MHDQEKKYRLIIFFAVATMFGVPVASVFLFPSSDGSNVLVAASYTIGFWVAVLGLVFLNMVIKIGREKFGLLAEAIKSPRGTLLEETAIFRNFDPQDLINRLVIYGNGNIPMLKKILWSQLWGMSKLIFWLYSFALVTPFMLSGKIPPLTPLYIIAAGFAYLGFSFIVHAIRGEQKPELEAMGLVWNRDTGMAKGPWAGHHVEINFEETAVTTVMKKSLPVFKASFGKKHFECGEKTSEPVKNFLEGLDQKEYWQGVTAESDGNALKIHRKYTMVEDTPANDYWMCDLWLAEKLSAMAQ
jgi:hypothetical protein